MTDCRSNSFLRKKGALEDGLNSWNRKRTLLAPPGAKDGEEEPSALLCSEPMLGLYPPQRIVVVSS
jgi:hypothetical protein